MTNAQLILMILGMFVVTYPFRFFPVLIFNRFSIPKNLKIWLSYVPVSVFAALVTQSLFEPLSQFDLGSKLPLILGGAFTIFLTTRTKSLGWGMGIGFIIFLILALSLPAKAAEKTPIELTGVGIEEHLGSSISLDLPFINEKGEEITLKHFFEKKRPVILTLVYYNCPNLCHYLLDGFTESLRNLSWTVGREFEVVTLSIDPTETASVSSKKKVFRVKKYERKEAEEGWHFLTGKEENIRKLAHDVGFKYQYDIDQKEYAHGAAIFILTPEGKISRTLYGIQFSPLDLKLALLEASQGKIGNIVDKVLLFCYHYDPKGRKYAIFAVNLMKIAGIVTVIMIGISFFVLMRRKR